MNITIRKFDWILSGTLVLLFSIGIAMLFSASLGDPLVFSRLIRQVFSFAIALTIYFIISAFPYHSLKRYVIPIYIIGLIALMFVGQIAPVIRGTTSRAELFGIQVQPSEFMKIAIVIILAWLFAKYSINRATIIVSAVLVTLASTLIATEPDIGEAALIMLLWGAFIIYIGVPWRTIGFLSLIGILVFFGAWHWLFADYQKSRLTTFMDPTDDPLGAGYNITQSIVALGSGGFIGRGLGHGPQSQLKFLPERHTDFILASVGEELGFVGICLIVSLYTILLLRIIKIAQSTKDPFGQYLASSIFILLLISFFISAGMNMGLLPVTGIPLPLVSYGGSSLVGTMALLGIVQSVKHYSHWLRKPPTELTEFT
jgi:rod shape determining protein RodA